MHTASRQAGMVHFPECTCATNLLTSWTMVWDLARAVLVQLEGDARASSAKHELEERQRAEKKRRVAENGSWTARWFKPADRHTDADMYEDIKEFEEVSAQRRCDSVRMLHVACPVMQRQECSG